MTKIELAIESTNWKIEDAEKTISNIQEDIRNSISNPHPEYHADNILSDAVNLSHRASSEGASKTTKPELSRRTLRAPFGYEKEFA